MSASSSRSSSFVSMGWGRVRSFAARFYQNRPAASTRFANLAWRGAPAMPAATVCLRYAWVRDCSAYDTHARACKPKPVKCREIDL